MDKKGDSQTKIKTTKSLRKGYSFLIKVIKAVLIGGAFLFLSYIFIARPFQITGVSMLPTLKDKSYTFFLVLPLRFINPGRQDVITNTKNPTAVGVSRIIGISGDKIVLRDGFVFLNGKLLDEPYTLRPRSTWVYSDDVLGQNCQEIVVPKNNYFVIGDNREASGFGFIPKDQIIGYAPHDLVKFLTYFPIDWSNHLRDTSHDKDLMNKSVLDINKYVELINKKRTENGISPLKYDNRLEKSAGLRLGNMLKYNDFSYEATKSGYTVWEALSDVGYNKGNALEAIVQGYYTSSDLSNSYWQSEYGKNLLNKDLQYLGIASTVINTNNCPNQIIVQHFLGQ